MVRFGLAASTLQKAAGRKVLSSSSGTIGASSFKRAAARLTSPIIPNCSASPVTPIINDGSSTTALQHRYLSSSSLQERGLMDDNNLLQFATLHELQRNASEAFASNPLFGTYEAADVENEDAGGEFKWMTYEEWGKKVDACRTVLKNDCGEFFL